MKQIFIILSLLLFGNINAQQKLKDFKNIMQSNSIYEIDAFLNVAHENDPRRAVLKPRLMGLISDYIKTAHPRDQRIKDLQEKLALLKRRPNTKISFEEMNAIIKQKQIKKYKEELELAQRGLLARNTGSTASTAAGTSSSGASGIANPEQDEFNLLMNSTPEEHTQKTVKLLNKLFDNDVSSTDVIVMVENKSKCDIIVRIDGAGNMKYRLAIPTKSENSIVITKGDYLFTSLVCGAQYASQKTVQKAIMVSLDNPGK